MNKIIKTAKDLIKFKSITGNSKEIDKCLKYIIDFYKDDKIILQKFKYNKIKSILISLKSKNPKIILHGHIDVVPVFSNKQFLPIVKNNKLYGRGSNDMKTAVAVMMHVLKDLNKLDIGLLITTDEEVGGYNGAYFLSKILKPEFIISGEITDLYIGNQAKGVLQFELTIPGKIAHSAKPWEGINPIDKLGELISEVKKINTSKKEYYTTITITKANSGIATNQIPPDCKIFCDMRYIPKDNPNKFIKRLSKFGKINITAKADYAYCDPNNKYIQELLTIMKNNKIKSKTFNKHAASDVRHFTEKNIPGIVFGPKGNCPHTKNEYVDVTSIKPYYNILKEFCKNK